MRLKKMVFCPYCNKNTIVSKRSTSHGVHFILTLITGFWVIVWIMAAISNRYYRCEQCKHIVGD